MQNKQWLVAAGIIVALLGLVFWRSRQARNDLAQTEVEPTQALEQRVNEFLQERNITLPEGAERINLESKGAGNETGVVTLEKQDAATDVSVIAGLPELSVGSYQAKLIDTDSGDEKAADVALGSLTLNKGGFLLDKRVSEDITDFELIQVVKGDEVVLEGKLK
jgi:hypothetical protein